MSAPYQPVTKPIKRTSLNLAVSRLASKLSVFVAGPAVDKSWSKDELEKQPAATRLRLSIKDWIETDWQHEVIFGEHRGVNEMGDEHFGDHNSAAIAEMALINDCDAIIVIPASAGSFCELGAWSTRDDYCRKLLIIADERFQNDISYIKLGTFRMAINDGAKVLWINFDDFQNAKDEVAAFVKKAHDRALHRAVSRGYA